MFKEAKNSLKYEYFLNRLWVSFLSSDKMSQGSIIAKRAFLIILAVGIAEIVVSLFAMTVSLLADGIHAISTGVIFLIVWIGLRLSRRSPDGTFHFGYYRIEALGSLIAAFILVGFGTLILFQAYDAWLTQNIIVHPEAAIVVASIATVVTGIVSWQTEKSSQKYNSTALGAGGITGFVDVLSSIGVAVSVSLSAYFGILHADSIAGILIAVAIFAGAYSIFKESSLVLVDACKCGDVVNAIADIARSVEGVNEVHTIRMRRLGSYVTGDMHIVVNGQMNVKEADEVITNVEEKIQKEFESVIDIKVRIESSEAHDRHSNETN